MQLSKWGRLRQHSSVALLLLCSGLVSMHAQCNLPTRARAPVLQVRAFALEATNASLAKQTKKMEHAEKEVRGLRTAYSAPCMATCCCIHVHGCLRP